MHVRHKARTTEPQISFQLLIERWRDYLVAALEEGREWFCIEVDVTSVLLKHPLLMGMLGFDSLIVLRRSVPWVV